jgi:hypothetical protein
MVPLRAANRQWPVAEPAIPFSIGSLQLATGTGTIGIYMATIGLTTGIGITKQIMAR